MKNFNKNEKGSITLFVLIAMIFFLTIAMSAYVSAMNKLQGQNAEIERIKASYEQDLTEEGLASLYDKLTHKEYKVIYDSNGLPEEYQEVEYIKSTGTQYIDTEIKATNKTIVKAKLYTENTGNKNWFGGSAYSSNNYVLNSWNQNKFEYTYGSNSAWYTPAVNDSIVNTPFIVEYGDGVIKINDKKIVDLPTEVFNDDKNLFIFSRANGTQHIDGKLYYFKVYEDDMENRNYVPCYRKVDNVKGLYDLVENKFYSNTGTGTFEKGADTTISGTMAPQTFTYGVSQNLTNNSFVKAGYTFDGWNTKKDGSGISYQNGQTVSNLSEENSGIVTLYAQWKNN